MLALNCMLKCGLLATALFIGPTTARAFCMTPQEYVKGDLKRSNLTIACTWVGAVAVIGTFASAQTAS